MPPVFATKTVTPAMLAVILMGASHGNVAAELEEITIIGSQASVREIAGTGAIIGSAQIRDELATDVNQLLKTIPGNLYSRGRWLRLATQYWYSRCHL